MVSPALQWLLTPQWPEPPGVIRRAPEYRAFPSQPAPSVTSPASPSVFGIASHRKRLVAHRDFHELINLFPGTRAKFDPPTAATRRGRRWRTRSADVARAVFLLVPCRHLDTDATSV